MGTVMESRLKPSTVAFINNNCFNQKEKEDGEEEKRGLYEQAHISDRSNECLQNTWHIKSYSYYRNRPFS